MGDKDKSGSSGTLGCLGAGVGIAALFGIFTLGPIDLARTGYNSLVGDIPLIRTQAVDYSRRNIARRNPQLSAEQVESKLAEILNYQLKGGEKVDPQGVRMMEVWDATEDNADGWYARWVWPRIN